MSGSQSSGPEAQHYIPQLYLKGFTDQKGILWVCEKFKPIRPSKPQDEAHRPDYYVHHEDGRRDGGAESTLAKIESQAAPILRKIGNPQYEISAKGSINLVQFVAAMFARVPAFRQYLDAIIVRLARTFHTRRAQDRDPVPGPNVSIFRC